MNAQSNNGYPSTKFAVLSDGENIAGAKKNYFIWISTMTILFCITVGYFSYKLFIVPTLFSNQKPQLLNSSNTYVIVEQPGNSKLKLYNPGPLLAGFQKRSQKDKNGFTCEESQVQIETIPSVFVEQTLQKNFRNLQDFINLDLLLHYENLINKFEPKSLKLIFNEYHKKLLLLKKSGDFVNFITNLKSNKFKFYQDILKQRKYNLELKHFENFFALTEELNHWYNYLHCLHSYLSIYEQQKLRQNFDNCTEKNFEIFTEETQKRLFHFAYPFKITEKKLKEINEIINMWSVGRTTEFYNCSYILYDKILILSDINEEIQRLNASCLKVVYALASHTIYLDEDLDLFGVNLAIVAPQWVFLKKVKITLDGITGKEFANKIANFNESGLPGNPGGNAGDFLAIGNLQEKYLIISANGGNGGKGQNGAKGLNGIHNTRPGPPINKPDCVSKLNTYNNSFGQTITHYKVFSPFGCGHSGTDGGVGGVGGTGGMITLITNNSIKITRGLNGIVGTSGKGGAGGTGGKNGCFYEILDVDDETLHPITRVKCLRGNILPSGEHGKDNYNSQGQIFLPEKENLTLHKAFYQFFRFTGQDFVKNNDPHIILFLKNLNQFDLYNQTSVKDIIAEYNLVKVFDKFEFYKIFNEKILNYMQHQPGDAQPILKYLASVVLGKMMLLEENINFIFFDFKNYLNLVERNIENTNERTRELQSVSSFKKKVHIKIEEIKANLNQIKMKATVINLNENPDTKSKEEYFLSNNSEHLREKLSENVSLIMTTTTEVLQILMTPISYDSRKTRSNDFLKIFKESTLVLSQTSHFQNNNSSSIKSSLVNAKKILLNTLENLQNKNSQKIIKDLSDLKDTFCILIGSDMLSKEIKNLLETLIVEIEHFIALYSFLEWEELEILFFKSLDSLPWKTNLDLRQDEEVKFLKSQLVDIMIHLQCKLAIHTAQLNLYSYKTTCLRLLQSKAITSAFTDHTNFQESIANEESADSFCKNHMKAVFDKHSAVGEFYFWSNAKIRNKLKNLFLGLEINLKSDIINHHVFDKNFIQFRILKLVFESGNTSQRHLQDILSNFKIQMIHSGYSYYNRKGETYVFVSEKVSLEYSFRMQDNNEPEVYNNLYKKCQDGEIRLSPFTIWSLRLLPLNDATDFSKLLPFADTVNLRLIGTGTYIS